VQQKILVFPAVLSTVKSKKWVLLISGNSKFKKLSTLDPLVFCQNNGPGIVQSERPFFITERYLWIFVEFYSISSMILRKGTWHIGCNGEVRRDTDGAVKGWATMEHTINNSTPNDSKPRPSLLLIDGNPLSAWNTGKALTQGGFEVQTAVDGNDALHLLASRQFDLMITELYLAGVDGLTLVDWVSQNRPDTVIVVTSTGTSESARKHCLENGCILFVDKETDPGFLVNTLGHYFNIGNTVPEEPVNSQAVLQPMMEAASHHSGGEIVVSSKDKVGKVFFFEGRLAWAHVSSDDCGLARDLVEYAGLSKSDLKNVFEECRSTERNFAETLVESGFIDGPKMRELLLDRVVRCLLQMSDWESPKALFLPKHRTYKGELLYPLDEVIDAMSNPTPKIKAQLPTIFQECV
jgi:CheY-like chemotaxis protein